MTIRPCWPESVSGIRCSQRRCRLPSARRHEEGSTMTDRSRPVTRRRAQLLALEDVELARASRAAPRGASPLLLLLALAALGCSDRVFFSPAEGFAQHEPDARYEALFPYYVELCA